MESSEKVLFDGFHKITEVKATVKNQEVKREKLLLNSAVAGIVIDEDHKVALVEQYRPVPERTTKEIPAGLLDKPGLTPIETLVEELLEECEVLQEDILYISKEPIHDYYMMVGNSDARIALYEIHVKRQKNKKVNDREVDSVEWVDLATYEKYITDGMIVDGKTLIAYYYVKQKSTHSKTNH